MSVYQSTATWLSGAASSWPDFVALFVDLLPRHWPKRMFRRGGKAWGDLEATGEIMAHARAWLEQVFRWFIPTWDDEAAMLEWWEQWLGLEAESTTADRQAAIQMAMLSRGTSIEELLIAMCLPCFTPADRSHVSISSVDKADIVAQNPSSDDPAWSHNFSFIVHGDGTLTLNERMADEVRKRMPAPYFVLIAEQRVLCAGMKINRGVAGAE